jgi:hydrogenase expression/formation protein HypE
VTAERVKLDAGGGGQEQRRLIETIRARLSNPALDPLEDSAVLDCAIGAGESLVFTTDSYVVSPWRFPGGDVGSLAVCGTVNDLAVMGAIPRWLSLALIIEEGFSRDDLDTVLESVARRAEEAGVQVVTGDTKVVERGKADCVFATTAGVGIRPSGRDLGAHRIAPGQALIVSGPLGDHAIAVICSREGMQFEVDVESDCAPLNGLVEAMLEAAGPEAVFAMRDLTRGGLAAVLNEYALGAQADMVVHEERLPIRPAVRAAARVLGFEPAVLANEGKLLAAVDAHNAESIVAAMRAHHYGRDAVIIGEVGGRFDPEHPDPRRPRRPLVLFRTPSGGTRVVDMPLGTLLPRIC